MGYNFDPVAKTIEPDTITSTVTVNVRDVYSRWKEWITGSALNAGYGEVFKTEGGAPRGGGLRTGFYLFLSQGWSFNFPTGITNVVIEGDLERDPLDLSGAPLVVSDGAQIEFRVSVAALGYSTSGGEFSASDRAALNSAASQSTANAAAISALNDLSAAQVEAAALAAITAYDPLVAADLSDIQSNIGIILQLNRNNYTVDADANTGTIFADDGTTPLFVYDLFDSDGTPASENVYRKVLRVE